MSDNLTCGPGGSTKAEVIERINQNEALTNSKPNKNLIINGNMLINQRIFDGVTWVNDEYAYDRWKATATAMTQIIEDGSYEYETGYTLSGTGITTQQIISPSSGHWTLPDIPRTSNNIKLEKGGIATPYQSRLISEELALCQRYYQYSDRIERDYLSAAYASTHARGQFVPFNTTMRILSTVVCTDGEIYISGVYYSCDIVHSGQDVDGFSFTISNTNTMVIGNTYPTRLQWSVDAEL